MGELLQVRFHGHVATGHQLSKLVLVAREIFFVINMSEMGGKYLPVERVSSKLHTVIEAGPNCGL